jgi:hypothetical protein
MHDSNCKTPESFVFLAAEVKTFPVLLASILITTRIPDYTSRLEDASSS